MLLDGYRNQLRQALAGAPQGAVFREAAWAVHEFGVPERVLYELLDGVARDLEPVRYATWRELETYCNGVASTVGVMCTHIFGVTEARRDAALPFAETLGVAMQLTNVLRDVGKDARVGRCYLPSDELKSYGIDVAEIFENPELARDSRWCRFMTFEIARARKLYADAYPGIAMLEPDARRCAAACAIGYAAILDAIERIGYDSLSRRASVGPLDKVTTLWRAWTYDPHVPAGVPALIAAP